jgi:hypothetical protein
VLKKAIDYIIGLRELIGEHDGTDTTHYNSKQYEVMFAF